MSKTKKIISILLAVVFLVATAGITLFAILANKAAENIMPEMSDTGGMVIGTPEETQIALMSMKIPRAMYEENGISPQAESAYTLTATVSPNNDATNTAVKWSIAWKNASSEWATEKTVADYVALEWDNADYVTSKTATVSCLQAFAEQIEVTVTSVDNPTYSATVAVDYAVRFSANPYLKMSGGKKVFSPVWGGDTEVTLEVAAGQKGTGGRLALDLFAVTQDYTVGDTFKVTLSLKNGGLICGGVASGAPGGTSYGIQYDGEAIISQKAMTVTPGGSYVCGVSDLGSLELCNDALFSKYHFAYYSSSAFGGSSDTPLTNVDANTVFNYFSLETSGALKNETQKLWDLVLTVEGTHSSYEWTTALMVTHVTNSTSINGLSVADSAITF